MSNIELIDDYLMNRLSGEEKVAFEKQLETDSSLQSEVALQKAIVEGIKSARAAQLKEMLNNVPVGSAAVTTGKIIAGVAAVGAIAIAAYFYTKSDEKTAATEDVAVVTEVPKAKLTETKAEVPATKKETVASPASEPTANVISKEKRVPKTVDKPVTAASTPAKPSIQATDPSEEMGGNATADAPKSEGTKSLISTSRITVETDASDTRYSFHYQFRDGKLILFGKFDKGLYEILEINGDTHSMFLYYKDGYYLLDEHQKKVTALEPIKDAALIRKLKEYRN
jgi:hypothetical protein